MMQAIPRFFKKFTQCASGSEPKPRLDQWGNVYSPYYVRPYPPSHYEVSKWEVALLAERRAAIPALPAALSAVPAALPAFPAALPAVSAALPAPPSASPSASIVMSQGNAWKSSASEIQPACEGSCTCCGKSSIISSNVSTISSNSSAAFRSSNGGNTSCRTTTSGGGSKNNKDSSSKTASFKSCNSSRGSGSTDSTADLNSGQGGSSGGSSSKKSRKGTRAGPVGLMAVKLAKAKVQVKAYMPLRLVKRLRV